MAPELHEGDSYNFGVDLWSLGIILYEIFHDKNPFKAKSTISYIKNLSNLELKVSKKVNYKVIDLIMKLLVND